MGLVDTVIACYLRSFIKKILTSEVEAFLLNNIMDSSLYTHLISSWLEMLFFGTSVGDRKQDEEIYNEMFGSRGVDERLEADDQFYTDDQVRRTLSRSSHVASFPPKIRQHTSSLFRH